MANCPHCGRKLHLYDWRPTCPGCGVNLIYYDSNKRLLEESEKAEIEHAHFQPRIDRAKAAYAGSPFAILRIVLTLLPVGALFLPLLRGADGAGVNVIGVYQAVSAYGFGGLFGGVLRDPMCLGTALLLVSAAMILVSLILILCSLGKRARIRVPVTYGFMLLCALGSIAAFALGGAQPAPLFPELAGPARPGIGAYLFAALFLVLFFYNLFLLHRGIPVRYKQSLIGGLPSEEYFRYVEAGMSRSEINRKMLVALAQLKQAQDRELEKEGAETNV